MKDIVQLCDKTIEKATKSIKSREVSQRKRQAKASTMLSKQK